MAAGTGSKCFKSDPVWFLGNMKMETVCNLDILGVTFNNNNNYDDHVKTRISKCKRSMYSLNSIGFCYPGLNTSSKVHLYKTICHPTLSYGMDSLNVKNKCIKQLESTQGCVIKQVCGLNKRAHHSSLLRALDIESVKTCIDKSTTLLYKRLCAVDSPTCDLCIFMLCDYMSKNILISGSILQRIVKMNKSPIMSMFGIRSSDTNSIIHEDGLADTLQNLLLHDNYVKPWSDEYSMVKLLTRSF